MQVDKLFCLGLQLFLIALALPMALNKVKPNRLYGLRTESTLADEKVWYKLNQKAGRTTVFIASCTFIILSLVNGIHLPLVTVAGAFILVVAMMCIQ